MIQLYIYIYLFFFKFFSHLDYYRILSSIPCAIHWVLVGYLLYIEQGVHVNPKIPIYSLPQSFPLVAIFLSEV